MPKALTVFFSLLWFTITFTAGFCVICAHIFYNKKIMVFQHDLSFQKARVSFDQGNVIVDLYNLYSFQKNLTINRLSHTFSIPKFFSSFQNNLSLIHIDKIAINYGKDFEKSIKEISENKGSSNPVHIYINSCDVMLENKCFLYLKNVELNSFPVLHCNGKLEYQGCSAQFSFLKKPFQNMESSLTWSASPKSKFCASIPYVQNINKKCKIFGSGNILFKKHQIIFNSSLNITGPDTNLKGSLNWLCGETLTILFPTLSLKEADFLSHNTISNLTKYDLWSLQEASLKNTKLAININMNFDVDKDSLQVESDIISGVVFIKNVFTARNIKAHFSLKDTYFWSVDVKSASSDQNVSFFGPISHQGALFKFTAEGSSFIPILERLQLLPANTIVLDHSKVYGEIAFAARIMPEWANSIKGVLFAENVPVSLSLPFLSQPLHIISKHTKVSVDKSVVSVESRGSWLSQPFNLSILWDKKNPAWHIKTHNICTHHNILEILYEYLPFWESCSGEVFSHIAVPFNPQKPIRVHTQGTSEKGFAYKFPFFEEIISVQKFDAALEFKEKASLKIKLSGPSIQCEVKGSVLKSLLSLQFDKLDLWQAQGVSGEMITDGAKTQYDLLVNHVDLSFIDHIKTAPSSQTNTGSFAITKLENKRSSLHNIMCSFKQDITSFSCKGSFSSLPSQEKEFLFSGYAKNKFIHSIKLKGGDLFFLPNFFGLDVACETKKFNLDVKMNQNHALKIKLTGDDILLKKIPKSYLTKNKDTISFSKGIAEGLFHKGTLKIEKLSLNSPILALIVANGSLNLTNGFLMIPGHLEPAPVIKKGAATLTPELATVVGQKTASLSNVFWHFNFKKKLPPLSLENYINN